MKKSVKSNIMNQKEYEESCRQSDFNYAMGVIEKNFLDVIDQLITKSRAFPLYPIEELKKEALEWLKLKG